MALSLRALADDLWDCEMRFQKAFLHMRIRMTVVRLPSHGLLLYSPVPIDDELARQLAELGPVEHIVAPSCLHDLHSGAAKQRYPRAKLWGAPGLAARRPDLVFDAELSDNVPEWAGTLENTLLRGVPRINEVVFFHRPARALLCADFLFNIQDERSAATRIFWKLFGVWQSLSLSRAFKWFIKDKAIFGRGVHQVLAWDPEIVLMGHGDVLRDAKQRLPSALKTWASSSAPPQLGEVDRKTA